jgi:hypothetical protein
VKITHPATAQPEKLPAATPSGKKPSSRKALIDGLAATPAGAQVLRDLGLLGAQGVSYGPSKLLLSTTNGDSLATAYAAGITLTAEGCGVTFSNILPAIEYCTYTAIMDTLRFQSMQEYPECRISAQMAAGDAPILRLYMYTPGSAGRSCAYLLEICMSRLEQVSATLNGEPLELLPTGDDTGVALVQLPGSEGRYHNLDLLPERRNMWGDFEWFSAMAL